MTLNEWMCFKSYFYFTSLFRMKKSLEPGQGFELATFHFRDKCNGLLTAGCYFFRKTWTPTWGWRWTSRSRRTSPPPRSPSTWPWCTWDRLAVASTLPSGDQPTINSLHMLEFIFNDSFKHLFVRAAPRASLEKLPFKVADVSWAREVIGSEKFHPMSPTCRE